MPNTRKKNIVNWHKKFGLDDFSTKDQSRFY